MLNRGSPGREHNDGSYQIERSAKEGGIVSRLVIHRDRLQNVAPIDSEELQERLLALGLTTRLVSRSFLCVDSWPRFRGDARNMTSERRRSPRFPFFASAEITDIVTGIRLTSRTSELSDHGCYFDMMNPMPDGAVVRLKITNHQQIFEAQGRVVYAQSNKGMGVTFDKMDAQHIQILEKWLRKLQGL